MMSEQQAWNIENPNQRMSFQPRTQQSMSMTGGSLAGGYQGQAAQYMGRNVGMHEAYRLAQRQAGTTGVEAGASSGEGGQAGGFNPYAAGAGIGASMLTNYLLTKYAGADQNEAGVASAAAGGASAGAVGGAGGAAAGTGSAAGIGAMYGVGAYTVYMIASSMIDRYFGKKPSGRDKAAANFYNQVHSKQTASENVHRTGFKDRNEMLSRPYLWMTQQGRDYREAEARGENPGKGMSFGMREAMKAPEYRPSEWQAWAGGMMDAGMSATRVMDATAYYMGEKSHQARTDAATRLGRGEEWYMNPENDPKVPHRAQDGTMTTRQTALTEDQRKQRWQDVQEGEQRSRIPWMTEGFGEAYKATYGQMQEAPKLMSQQEFTQQYGHESNIHKKFGSSPLLGQKLTNYLNRKKRLTQGPGMLIPGSVGKGQNTGFMRAAYGPTGDSHRTRGGKGSSVEERVGISAYPSQFDTRQIWGEMSKKESGSARPGYKYGKVLDPWGESPSVSYGWIPEGQEEYQEPETETDFGEGG
jgi:hypothetical protein